METITIVFADMGIDKEAVPVHIQRQSPFIREHYNSIFSWCYHEYGILETFLRFFGCSKPSFIDFFHVTEQLHDCRAFLWKMYVDFSIIPF